MKITGIKKNGFTRVGLPAFNRDGFIMQDAAIRNKYILTIEEDTPLGFVAENEIDAPSDLIDELDAFMEQFSIKCEKEYERMKIGVLY